MGLLKKAHDKFVQGQQIASTAKTAIQQQHAKVDSSYNHRFFEKRSDYKKFKTVLEHYGIEEKNIDISGSQGEVLKFSLQCKQSGEKLSTSNASYSYNIKTGFLDNSYLRQCFETKTDYEDFLVALRPYNIDPNYIQTIEHSATCIKFPLKKTSHRTKKVSDVVFTYDMRKKILTDTEISRGR